MPADAPSMVLPPHSAATRPHATRPAAAAGSQRDPREAIVRQHLRDVWRFLRLLGATPDESDDLCQETFVVALHRGTGDRAPPQVGAFLRRTARHLFLRARRQRGRRAALLAAAAEQLWERVFADGGADPTVAALRECTAALGDRPRRLVQLFYGEQRSRAEVAQALGLQENGVKTALQRLRETLRECVRRKLS